MNDVKKVWEKLNGMVDVSYYLTPAEFKALEEKVLAVPKTTVKKVVK